MGITYNVDIIFYYGDHVGETNGVTIILISYLIYV